MFGESSTVVRNYTNLVQNIFLMNSFLPKNILSQFSSLISLIVKWEVTLGPIIYYPSLVKVLWKHKWMHIFIHNFYINKAANKTHDDPRKCLPWGVEGGCLFYLGFGDKL